MFLDGLSAGDSGCPGSLLAREVSRPLFFLITAWLEWADAFLLLDFSILLSHLYHSVCVISYKFQSAPFSAENSSVITSSCWLWYFTVKSYVSCVFLIYCHLLNPFDPCCHSVWLSEVCVDIFGDHPSVLDLRPLSHSSLLLSQALFCLYEHTDSFSWLFYIHGRWMSFRP